MNPGPLYVRYIVLLNEQAGKAGNGPAEASPDALRAAFVDAGISAEVRALPPDRIQRALADAVAARPDALIVGGGDGTVRSAAALLADTGVTLGVLPLGTFNHFAKDLQIPTDVKDAVAVLIAGATREVDVGEVNGHVFINNCSLGAYAEAVRRRDALRDRRGLGKWWAMCRASLEEFRRLRRLRLRIRLSERRGATITERMVRTPVVIVGNNRYSGHLLNHSLRPRLDGGRLWLYTVQARRHLGVLRMMLQSLVRRLDQADALAAEPATEIVIESDSGPVPIAADGEVLRAKAPFHFRIRPGALRVIAPEARSAPGEGQGAMGERMEDGRRKAEDGGQGAEDRGRRTENRNLGEGDRGRRQEIAFRFQLSGFRFPHRWPEAQR